MLQCNLVGFSNGSQPDGVLYQSYHQFMTIGQSDPSINLKTRLRKTSNDIAVSNMGTAYVVQKYSDIFSRIFGHFRSHEVM